MPSYERRKKGDLADPVRLVGRPYENEHENVDRVCLAARLVDVGDSGSESGGGHGPAS
jgi:hypothetical protein